MINEDIGRVNEGTTIFPVGQKEMQGPATECLAVPVFIVSAQESEKDLKVVRKIIKCKMRLSLVAMTWRGLGL